MPDREELQLEFTNDGSSADTYRVRTGRGFSVQHSRLISPSEFSFAWDGATHYLAHHDLLLLDGEISVDGGRAIAGGDIREKLTFVPAGKRFAGWAKPADRPNAVTVLGFDGRTLEQEVEAPRRQDALQERIYFRDNALGSTMKKLGTLLSQSGGRISQAYLEAVALTAAFEMAYSSAALADTVPASGELSHSLRERLRDYIEAHFSEDIGLDDMAKTCGLTRFHFSRAFKATFGEPPYRYLTRRRVAHARHLLAEGILPVSEIAGLCGFNGSTQFSRAFREFEDMSPLEFRRRVR